MNDELKRYIVVSPNTWNKASGTATLVRTTSKVTYDSDLFPVIQGMSARACCGEATTAPHGMITFGRRVGRPTLMTTTRGDLRNMARSFLVTHALETAAKRAGV